MTTSQTDCRSEEGITVGLIDAVMAMGRVLAPRIEGERTPAVKEALKDLRADRDMKKILPVYFIYGSGHRRARCSGCGVEQPFEQARKRVPFPHEKDCPALTM